jgi:hypothetical protein
MLCADVVAGWDQRDPARPRPGGHPGVSEVTEPRTADDVEAEFPDWEVWRGVDNRWHARIRGAEPLITVADDDLVGLKEEIVRKASQLEQRAWAEARQSSRDGSA